MHDSKAHFILQSVLTMIIAPSPENKNIHGWSHAQVHTRTYTHEYTHIYTNTDYLYTHHQRGHF